MNTTFTKKIKSILIAFCVTMLSCSLSYGNARVQIIHNSADPSVATVDVYIGAEKIEDLQFRKATAFINVASDAPVSISIAPSNSTSASEAIKTMSFSFTAGLKNTIILSGVQGTGYQANPNGRSIELKMFQGNAAKEFPNDAATVEFSFIHSATDMEVVDLVVEGQTAFADNKGYGDFSGYYVLAPGEYDFKLTNFPQTTTFETFSGDFTQLTGKTITLFTSGFYTPSDDNNGTELGLFGALADGTVISLNKASVAGLGNKRISFANLYAFPVPSKGLLNLEVVNTANEEVTVELLNLYGQGMGYKQNVYLNTGKNEIRMDLSDVMNGQYLVKVYNDKRLSVLRISLVR